VSPVGSAGGQLGGGFVPPTRIAAAGAGGGGGGSGSDDDLDLINDEAGTVIAGTPVYLSAAGHFLKAQADDIATGRVSGLAKADIAPGASGKVRPAGSITLTTDQWDAVAGTTGGLAFNVPYYLSADSSGALTATPPNVAGQVIELVLVALSPTKAAVKTSEPVVIGSGSNIIKQTNDNAAPLIICQPVFSSSADGVDLARANNSNKSIIVGLVADASIAPGARGNICVGGLMIATTAQWDAVCGTSGGLAPNTDYYLSFATAGHLIATPPTSPTNDGNEVVLVISAFSPTKARIATQPPILL
jgi:hypothetical protein